MPLTDNATSIAIANRSVRETLDQYFAVGRAIRARYEGRMRDLDPRLGPTHTTHLAHNWHRCAGAPTEQSVAITALLDRMGRIDHWLYCRQAREYHRSEHRQHIVRGESGRYLWCEDCAEYTAAQKAIKQPRLPLRAPRRKAGARG